MEEDTGSFADRLRKKEQAEENVFFNKHDRALVEKLRRRRDDTQRRQLRSLTHMRCPECGTPLEQAVHFGVTIEQCPRAHGLWLTESEMHALAKREHDSWIARYFYRPKLVK
jgi:DNA repair exonuclease SbcCD ATPase subunit